MIEFLFGKPGSGKTTYIIKEIEKNIAERKKTYLIVPEQQVYISEYMLASLPPCSALYFETVSFTRLAEIVFGEYGGLVKSDISSGAKRLIMWRNLHEISTLLLEYSCGRIDKKLCEMMLSLTEELRVNSITPEMLENALSDSENSDFSKKIHDIVLIYSNYNRSLEQIFGDGASGDILSRLSDTLAEHDFFKGKQVFIDSFTDFTGVELSVLRHIIKSADKVIFSASLPMRGFHSIYTESITQTVKKLTSFAHKDNIETRDTVLGENHRQKNAELKKLEETLWDFTVSENSVPEISEKDRGGIELAVCKNEYEEAEYMALRILEARENGYLFSEIAVIPRDAESRKGILNAVFDKHNIPFFYSERTDLSLTPAARFILSSLKCISYNYRLEDVLTLVKTGLCDISSRDCDLFEDYCVTWNISGSLFCESAWSMNPDGYTTQRSRRGDEILNSANKVRASVIPPLQKLSAALNSSEGNPLNMCFALYTYLKETRMAEQLSSLAEFELSLNNAREAGELIRIYDYIISALTDIGTMLSDIRITVDEFRSVIEILLSNTDIGSVPSVGDCVTIGSASTLRIENIKLVFTPGMCEGEFPASFSENSVLREDEKQKLEEYGIILSSRESKITSDELFYVYRAFTRPSEKLIITCCSSGIEGNIKYPSWAWNRIKFLFPYIEEELFDARAVKDALDAENRLDIGKSESTGEKNAKNLNDIDPAQVRMLFGNRIVLSKTTISAFAECPYRFWGEFILNLREQKHNNVGYADSGSYIHYVLEKFISELRLPDGTLRQTDKDTAEEILNRLTNNYVSNIGCMLSPSLLYRFSRLRDLTFIMAKSILDEFSDSMFRIAAFEEKITDRSESRLKPLEIKTDPYDEQSAAVCLCGTVDRIDYYDDGNEVYLRITDYKTGSKSFKINEISNGKDLQLPAYLFTVASSENSGYFLNLTKGRIIRPAAALYLSASEKDGKITPARSGFILNNENLLRASSARLDPDILAGITLTKENTFKGSPLVSTDEMSELENTLRHTVSSVARDIYAGKAPRRPSEDNCKFCKIRSGCSSACIKR